VGRVLDFVMRTDRQARCLDSPRDGRPQRLSLTEHQAPAILLTGRSAGRRCHPKDKPSTREATRLGHPIASSIPSEEVILRQGAGVPGFRSRA
jgi:hypothetical protein